MASEEDAGGVLAVPRMVHRFGRVRRGRVQPWRARGVVMLFWSAEFGMLSELGSALGLVHIAQGIGRRSRARCGPTPRDIVVGGGIAFLALCFGLTSLLALKWQVWIYGVLAGLAYGLLN